MKIKVKLTIKIDLNIYYTFKYLLNKVLSDIQKNPHLKNKKNDCTTIITTTFQ